jgi:hypothetical protein
MHRRVCPGARTSSTGPTSIHPIHHFPGTLPYPLNALTNFTLLLFDLFTVSIRFNVQVVLENPWLRVLNKLPDTLARKRYGT